jgi:hypothetical protein
MHAKDCGDKEANFSALLTTQIMPRRYQLRQDKARIF